MALAFNAIYLLLNANENSPKEHIIVNKNL